VDAIDWTAILSTVDWATVIGTVAAVTISAGVAIWLARAERRSGEKVRAQERLANAAERLSAAIDELSVAAMGDDVGPAQNAALRLQAAAVHLFLACDAADEEAIRTWIGRSGVLYREYAVAAIRFGRQDRQIVGGVVKLIELQLANWLRARAPTSDLLLFPPAYRSKYAPDDELIAHIPGDGSNPYVR
jgi:hypothetical protein